MVLMLILLAACCPLSAAGSGGESGPAGLMESGSIPALHSGSAADPPGPVPAENILRGNGWTIRTIDRSLGSGEECSLAFDGSGNPRILYNDVNWTTNFFRTRYAWRDATGWHRRKAAIPGATSLSIAVDRNGKTRAGYIWEEAIVRYAWQAGNSWKTATADDTGNPVFLGSLALNRAGNPQIAYGTYRVSPSKDFSLKFAGRNRTGWHATVVDSTGYVEGGAVSASFAASLAVNGTGSPAIAYFRNTGKVSGSFWYAWREAGAWQTEDTGITAENCTIAVSLARDGAGDPRIACYNTSSGLMYAWRDGAGWHAETAAANRTIGTWALALNRTGTPYIAYVDNSTLTVAVRDGTGWVAEDIGPASSRHLSFAVSSAGKAGVSFYSVDRTSLKYAERRGA